MRVRTRNSLIVAGVVSCAVGGFLYPMVYLQYFAKDAMQHSADSAIAGGHTVRGAFINSGMRFRPDYELFDYIASLLTNLASVWTVWTLVAPENALGSKDIGPDPDAHHGVAVGRNPVRS